MWVENYSDFTQGTIVDGIDWGDELNPLSIVLSNACDLEHGHCSYILFAALVDAKAVLTSSKEFQSSLNDGKISTKTAKKFFEKYIHNKEIGRYYFFDPSPVIDAGYLLVDFQRICSVKYNAETIDKLEKIGQLKHPFVEQMMMRFVAYTSRIPSDRVDENKVDEYVTNLSKNFI